MPTFTCNIPDELLDALSERAAHLAVPKNKLIEKALRLYLDHLNRAEYIRSFRQAARDENILDIAKEGI